MKMAKATFQRPKGTADLLPEQTAQWQYVENLARVLFGDYNPAGRLPVSVPRSEGQIPVYYNKKAPKCHDYVEMSASPLYSFGYGLSYTEYDVQVNGKIVRQEQEYLVPVKVTNLGNMTGKTVVQIYIGKKKSLVARPVKLP